MFDPKINEEDPVNLSDMISVNGVSLHSHPEAELNVLGARKKLYINLTDSEISAALEYLFKKATQEIVEFYNMKEIDKVGYFKDEILVSKCRLLEDQELKIVGGLEDFFDLDNFIGLKSCVPLVSKHSPLAVSIAIHMHYNVNKHIGAESTYRMSLLNVKILGGKQLFKEVSNDCIYCMKLRKRYCEQLMGPLSSSQISMSPIFYFVTVDMWGPILIYTPGYEKRTRNRKMEYEAYMFVFACCVTGGINCQIIEKT